MAFLASIRARLISWLGGRPPYPPIYESLQSVYLARAYYVVACLGIADMLKERSLSCAELADITECDEESLHRILRALASVGVFRLDSTGRYAMTAPAELLRSDAPGSMRDWIRFIGRSENWRGFEYALESVKTGVCGFELGQGKGVYEYGLDNAEYDDAYIAGMNGWTEWQCSVIADAFDFGRYSTVVDVAGGHGRLLIENLRRHENLRGVLFDQPSVIERTQSRMDASGYASRCELVGGNALESVPGGGDLYVLKHVLRDWDDEQATQILKNCAAMLPENGALLVIEGVLDPRNGRDNLQKLLDLEQMFWLSGRIRTRPEWDTLLAAAGLETHSMKETAIVDGTLIQARKAG